MKIQESNELIAEFMELPTTPLGLYVYGSNHLRDKYGLEYHKSWSWLMPVVEKIETMPVKDRLPEFFVMYDNRDKFKGWFWIVEVCKKFRKQCVNTAETKIEATYESVIAFIQWYNQNK